MTPSDSSSSGSGFWPALEAIGTLSAVRATWRKWLGDDFERARRAFLKAQPAPARFVPCPAGCGCWHEVIPEPAAEAGVTEESQSAARLVAVCGCESWSCDDLVLEAGDVVVWDLDSPRLDLAICRALGLDYRAASLGLPGARQIGPWSVAAVPAVLVLQHDRAGFRLTLAELAARLRQPFILLAPASGFIDAPGRDLLSRAGAAFFDLASNLVLTAEGALVSVRTPGELFARFCPEPEDASGEMEARKWWALAKAMDGGGRARKAALFTVFRLCVDGLSPAQIARQCRCDRTLIFARLKTLRSKLGCNPADLRRFSAHFQAMEDALADSRARRIHRPSAVYGDEETEPGEG